MADLSNIPEDMRAGLEELIKESPEYVAKFGNPLDANDPRNWSPSERKERGVSFEDRLTFLELDVEAQQTVLSKVSLWMIEQQRKEMLAEMKNDPEAFLRKMMGQAGSRGPNGDTGPAFAGSTVGIAPDEIVDTVDGPIRADQIPGYRNEPGWHPSPDWADANCTCPTHTQQREAAKGSQLNGDDNFPNGFYL